MNKLNLAIVLGISLSVALFSCSNNHQEQVSIQDSTVASVAVKDSLQIQPELLLTPGVAAGKIKIDENAETVFKVLGKPDSSDAAMQKMVAFWFKGHDKESSSTSIYTVRDTGNAPIARVKQIRITDPAFQTKEKIGVSSLLSAIKLVYEVHKIQSFQSINHKFEVWDSLVGIAFEINTAGKCTAIIIHKKAEELSGTYLPFR